MGTLLDVRNLETRFKVRKGFVYAVNGVSFSLDKGEMLGVVGESGCGKSVTMMSLIKLLPPAAQITNGSVVLDGVELTTLSRRELNAVRGSKVGMIFQDPMTSLNPFLKIGLQLAEGLVYHKGMSMDDALKRSAAYLDMVGISNSAHRLNEYPHQLSGGMRQRVMIAMALLSEPELVIADEPTTALDVTIQAQILALLKELTREANSAMILITHDLGVVANLCDSIRVMYAGKIVEEGKTRDIFYEPRHPYTWGLLNSIPKINIEEKERLVPIDGQPPDLLKPPAGCAFAERCPHVMAICQQQQPPLIKAGQGHEHRASCWLNHAQAEAVAAPLFAAQTQQDKLEGQA